MTFTGTCKRHEHPFTTTDAALFVAHVKDDGDKPIRPSVNPAPFHRMWRTPRPKPFDPEPFDRGDDVEWDDGGTIRTGQVWALAYRDLRWVADGKTYHLVDIHAMRSTRAALAAA